MSLSRRIASLLPTCVALVLISGCRRSTSRQSSPQEPATNQSAALPGPSDAADAPESPAVRESAGGVTTLYRDPETGVSFRYPSVWRPRHAGSTMYAPAFSQGSAGPARITQTFDPQGTLLARTNLVGLSFSYTVKSPASAETCKSLAVGSTEGGYAKPAETIHGVTFAHAVGSDAGMCHQMGIAVDTALEGNRCYVFERDFETICPEVRGPGDPVALTKAQQQQLQVKLDSIMGSVTLH